MDNDKHHSHIKFVPTIANILDCAKKLPEAKGYKSQTADIPLEGKKGLSLTFERIKYVAKDGESEARWSYKGRILIGDR